MAYTTDPEYYDRQIAERQKTIKQLNEASYNTNKRGYVVGKNVYSDAQIKSKVETLTKEIQQLNVDKKTYGKYGPNVGEKAASNEAGKKFQELFDAAQSIQVTDFDSAVQSVQAWKAVEQFVKKNKNIRVVAERTALVEGERGRSVERTVPIVVDPAKDSSFKEFISNGVQSSIETATQKTEEGTVKSETVVKGKGAAATRSVQKTVIDQSELTRRQGLVDQASAGKTVIATGSKTFPASDMKRSPRMFEEATKNAKGKPTKKKKPAPVVTPGAGGTDGGADGAKEETTPATATVTEDWKSKFREMFPASAWLLDIDATKYSDLQTVLEGAVKNRMWETTEGQTRFSAQLDNTTFFKELKTNNIVRDIKAAVGDLGFDSVPFNAFLTNAMNMGYKGDTLKQEAYKEAFRTDDNGVYVNPTAVERVKKSTPYLSVAKIGTDFFSQVSDKTIAGVLTGGMTQDDVVRQQRELAKTKYGHLSNLIDQGFSMADLAAQFQSRAATLLEVDPATIDMSQAKFETAYNFGEEGKKRMMTTGEWDRLLRTDKQFNWDQTENAKQEARKLADTISQAFGRVM